jgi:phosphoribosylanthranilate isomerase
MTAIKICGITRREDALEAARLGASFVGFILWPGSPRATTLGVLNAIAEELPADVAPVGVFVDPTIEEINAAVDAGIRLAQVHTKSVSEFAGARVPVLRAVHLAGDSAGGIEPDVSDELVLLDAHDPVRHGGTGTIIDWTRATQAAKLRRIILAGGLTPFNVRQAIEQVQPFGVDVASGVESSPGIKDHGLLRAFIAAAKERV